MGQFLRTSKPKLPPVAVVNTAIKIKNGFSRIQKVVAPTPPPVQLLELVSGMWISQAVGVVARFGVADQILGQPTAVEDIAKKTNSNPEALYRIMRALSTVGVFQEFPGRKFDLTEVGKCLKTDHPQSMRYVAMFQGGANWAHWGALDHCLKTGKNAVEHVRGTKPFEYFAANKDIADVFDRAMTNVSEMELDAILSAYNFSGSKVIADIGGGYGAFLASILSTHPNTKGILYDLPHVVEQTKKILKEAKMLERIDVIAGSFFEAIPSGADTYLMKHIIHDWSDEECIKIFKNIRAKIPLNGKLLLFETIIPDIGVSHFSKFLDLEMLVVTTGKERTENQYKDILGRSSFRLNRVVPTISMASVLECVPV